MGKPATRRSPALPRDGAQDRDYRTGAGTELIHARIPDIGHGLRKSCHAALLPVYVAMATFPLAT